MFRSSDTADKEMSDVASIARHKGVLFQEVPQGFFVRLFQKQHQGSVIDSNKIIKVAIEDLIEELRISFQTAVKLAMSGPANG